LDNGFLFGRNHKHCFRGIRFLLYMCLIRYLLVNVPKGWLIIIHMTKRKKGLYNILNRRQKSLPRANRVALGPDEQYYIEFPDKYYWRVNDYELDKLLERHPVEIVAFAPDDGYFAKFKDGSHCWNNIPISLHNKINGRQKQLPAVKSICIGEDAWFVQFEDDSWSWNGRWPVASELLRGVKSLYHFSISPSLDSFLIAHSEGLNWSSNALSQILYEYLDPADIHFTQKSIGERFSNGRSIYSTVKQLQRGEIEAEDFPPIHVFCFDDCWWSLDNRRLWTFKNAGLNSIPVKVVEINESYLHRVKVINNGESIYIRH
jgi:hypothetical protein